MAKKTAKKKAAKKPAKKPAKAAKPKKPGRLTKPIVTTVPYDARTSFRDIMAQINKDRAARELETRQKIAEIAEELYTLGVSSVEAEYSGEGDSGDVNYVAYKKINDKIKVPEDTASKLKDLIWALLPGGFENNDGGYGEVIIDTVNKKVRVEHHQRYVETTDSEEEFEL